MSAIVDVIAREILDSRGNPTVEADVLLESGVRVPGTSSRVGSTTCLPSRRARAWGETIRASERTAVSACRSCQNPIATSRSTAPARGPVPEQPRPRRGRRASSCSSPA